jgi:SAM-dependent methyltransferase
MTTVAERIGDRTVGDALRARAGAAALALPVFATTIALSAFLLFTVEPLVGRLTLPTFGGTPAVWATVLFFFQTVLLAGYAYGHVSATWLGPRRGAIVHVVLALAAVAALAVAPVRIGDLRDVGLPAVVNLVWILLLTVGAPALLITATTPLLSSWLAAIRAADGEPADTYWLYALSNAGSFAALLAYPFLIEPTLGLSAQRTLWAVGVVALVACLAGCAALVLRRVHATPRAIERSTAIAGSPTSTLRDEAVPAERIDWRRRARWLLLAAIPSGLLSAVTNFITTDLISAPLLWVVPLAIYLLTFVIAFSARGRRLLPGAEWLAPAAITLLWVPFGSAGGWPIGPLIVLEFVGLGIVATCLHGRLAADRPSPAHLTEFYLVMSAGGVLASSLVAVAAPIAFKGVWEYPLLLVLALGALALGRGGTGPVDASSPAVRRRFDLSPFFAGAPRRLAPYAVVAVALTFGLAESHSIGLEAGVRWLLVGGLILLVGGQPRFLFVTTALVLGIAVFVLSPAAIFQDRSFFGVTAVLRPPGSPFTVLMNGTTVHGIQSTDPALRGIPGSYYTPNGPLGDAFRIIRGRAAGRDGAAMGDGRSVGVVGLGSGTVAAWMRPGDRLTFYEIDPLVIRVAEDPAYFTWLADAATRPDIVVGDARLSLEPVASGSYDLLVLDAFSSDAVPAHLLTAEAIADDARVLRPDGMLAFHVSNRYYDLAPAVASAARQAGLTVLQRVYTPTEADARLGATISHWLIATREPDDVPGLLAAGWEPIRDGVAPLTDDHPDLLRLLRAGLW